jgi:adenosylcobyric acid synthase
MTLTLMFQGTGSDVGKSLLVAGLARLLTNRGMRVMPFKPQNMSNNAAVTADGGEIGRAQALQARAARVATSVHMNPVLLKPQSEVGAQVIVQGQRIGNAKAADYQGMKPKLMASVLDSFGRLAQAADIILVEGAGSASEINLRQGDIANMGFARATNTPVVLIGDIDRGGVIASLVGTKTVLPDDDATMIKGFIVNRFRGDPTLFKSGMTAIAERTGWHSFGLVPFFRDAQLLPAEDALALDQARTQKTGTTVKIVVLAYPHVSNFDDFDPLHQERDVDLIMLRPGQPIPGDANVVILPGSKTTIADLAALKACQWDGDLAAHLRRGGRVLGICGGYQMLGHIVTDPDGIEGGEAQINGLGLLDVATELTGDKKLRAVTGTLAAVTNIPWSGYEMHVGRTTGGGTTRPFLGLADGSPEGAVDADRRIAGCYIHGLFADDQFRQHWLSAVGGNSDGIGFESRIDSTLDALAQHLATHLDVSALLAAAGAWEQK